MEGVVVSGKGGKRDPGGRRAARPRRSVRRAEREPQPLCLGLPVSEPDPVARRLLEGIQLLVRRFAISERADVNCCGLTVAQSATLDALRAAGALRLSALGRRLGIAPSTLTRNLDRLEDAGLVARETDRKDARAARVRLTPAGHEAAAQVDRREEAFARSVLDRLPTERQRAALNGLFDLLLAVREATEACCPGAFDHLMTEYPESGCCPDPLEGGRNACD
jgi:DNA-binding MarR family transcriptional regulator